MDLFAWMAAEAELTAAGLTVRAQAVSPNDDGRLIWDQFFPRREADSIELTTIGGEGMFRPAADRREWNARGRQIPLVTPGIDRLEMVPIESYFKMGEYEIQKLEERTLGNESIFRQIVGTTVPERTDGLAEANYRRIEVDAFTAWARGIVQARNPTSGRVVETALNFDPIRYQVASTAWNDGAVNAYNLFISWYQDMVDVLGGAAAGVMLRTHHVNAIMEDAPRNNPNIRLTRNETIQRIQDDLGSAFQFFVNERTVDVFTGGSLATAAAKVWPSNRIAVVPADGRVGNTHFAPVARAFEIARSAPNAGVDIRGMTAYTEVANAGRELTVEVQANALPLPEEARTAVIDPGF